MFVPCSQIYTMRIILVGMPCVGKTTLGVRVARALGWEFLDTDALIEAQSGTAIAALIGSQGEEAFRALERELVKRLMTIAGSKAIIATGGGTVVDPLNRQELQTLGQLVHLYLPLPELAKRIQGLSPEGIAQRPLLQQWIRNGDLLPQLQKVYNARRWAYTLDTITINPTDFTPKCAQTLSAISK